MHVPRRIASALIILTAAVASAGGTDGVVCAGDDATEECRNGAVDVDDDGDSGGFDERGGGDCTDDNDSCEEWARVGECAKNPGYMLISCRRSCEVCNHAFDLTNFGVPQLITPHLAGPVRRVISKSYSYMNSIADDPDYASVIAECTNNEPHCSQWALGTGCDDNPNYMKRECSPACNSCDHILDLKKKCGLDPNGKDAMEAGGMDEMFEDMVRMAERSGWSPTVLSRPAKKMGTNEDGADAEIPSCKEDVTNPCNARMGPWVITLEDFLSPEEISVLVHWGIEIGYERSQAGDAIIEARTSAHAWCSEGCFDDPIVEAVRDRIAHVTGTPRENQERLQLLKYNEGQYYRRHNDFIDKHVEQYNGPRLLTFFMYFNEVPRGGGTRFPRLGGLTVKPRRGRVLIWPSVLDEDPYTEDVRTEHEAMAVEEGEKYAANAWIHVREFEKPFLLGCPM